MSPITIRRARPEDSRSLDVLAGLDSARPLAGDTVLVAEEGHRPLAAIDVISGRLIADPFTRTADQSDLLRARAAQVRPASARRRSGRRAFGRSLGFAR